MPALTPIRRALTPEQMRLTSDELCKHQWFSDDTVASTCSIAPDIDTKLEAYRARMRLKLRAGIAAALFTSSLRLSTATKRESFQREMVGTSEDLFGVGSTHSGTHVRHDSLYDDPAMPVNTDSGSAICITASPQLKERQVRNSSQASAHSRSAHSSGAGARELDALADLVVVQAGASPATTARKIPLPTIQSEAILHELRTTGTASPPP